MARRCMAKGPAALEDGAGVMSGALLTGRVALAPSAPAEKG
ncbi:MAG: hypothetical protein OZ921_08100 [Sorangiineae bacterium]|nr:hypothetical protein [Polyangiaceae bacterium]MEB2322460.1 hypothetical protein [Sorangiineae bacterium]